MFDGSTKPLNRQLRSLGFVQREARRTSSCCHRATRSAAREAHGRAKKNVEMSHTRAAPRADRVPENHFLRPSGQHTLNTNPTPVLSSIRCESRPTQGWRRHRQLPHTTAHPTPRQRGHAVTQHAVRLSPFSYLSFDLCRRTATRSRRLAVIHRRQVYHLISAHHSSTEVASRRADTGLARPLTSTKKGMRCVWQQFKKIKNPFSKCQRHYCGRQISSVRCFDRRVLPPPVPAAHFTCLVFSLFRDQELPPGEHEALPENVSEHVTVSILRHTSQRVRVRCTHDSSLINGGVCAFCHCTHHVHFPVLLQVRICKYWAM